MKTMSTAAATTTTRAMVRRSDAVNIDQYTIWSGA
jgi:hypothetical protein